MASDPVRDAAKRVARCKPVDWDCSRSPGHPGLDALLAAVDALRAALAAPVSPPAPRGEAVAWPTEDDVAGCIDRSMDASYATGFSLSKAKRIAAKDALDFIKSCVVPKEAP